MLYRVVLRYVAADAVNNLTPSPLCDLTCFLSPVMAVTSSRQSMKPTYLVEVCSLDGHIFYYTNLLSLPQLIWPKFDPFEKPWFEEKKRERKTTKTYEILSH